jgi:hypothetical protein
MRTSRYAQEGNKKPVPSGADTPLRGGAVSDDSLLLIEAQKVLLVDGGGKLNTTLETLGELVVA